MAYPALFKAYLTYVLKRSDFYGLPLECQQEIEQLFSDLVKLGGSHEEVRHCLEESDASPLWIMGQICGLGEAHPPFKTTAELQRPYVVASSGKADFEALYSSPAGDARGDVNN